jgi:membrane protein implicated in regulation of membrane protease activity
VIVLLWIVLGVVLVIAEAFTATFVLIMLAAGAFAAAAAAALGAPLAAQAAIFAVVSALSIWLLRPVIRRHALPTVADPDAMDGTRALEGAPGEVLEQVTTGSGLVRVEGEMWSARAYDATQVIEPGERVRVIEVRGTTAMVWRDEFGDILEDQETIG